MKFEDPIINISMFEAESVVTVSAGDQTTAEKMAEQSNLFVQGNTITVDFDMGE